MPDVQNAVAVVVVLAALVPGVWWVSHTRLVDARTDVDDSWADVDTELHRRYTIVEQLADSLHDTTDPELVAELTRRRDDALDAPRNPEAANEFEPPLVAAIDRALAARPAGAWPFDDENHAALADRLATVDDRIALAGSFYNTRVGQLDRRLDAFVSGFVARRHGFDRAQCFGL